MIQEAISEIFAGHDLKRDVAKNVMSEIMDGTATPAQIGAFLAALRMKGESIEEITACAEVMRDKSLKISRPSEVIDIVGTGGDCTNTFNISTTSSFVVAAAGISVAKHGNRSVSSSSGSADVLESLGACLDLAPSQSEKILRETGICFMFAQKHHPLMKNVSPIRKEMGARTIFNILGPLSNPAAANMMLLGVYDPHLVEPLAKVLSNLGVERGMVVYGNGLDEVSLTGINKICEIKSGTLRTYDLSPEDLGFQCCSLSDLRGGSPQDNARLAIDILSGNILGPKRDIVVFNSALALYIAGRYSTLHACTAEASRLIDEGLAVRKMNEFIDATRREGCNA